MRTMTRTDFHFSRLPGHPFGMPTGLAAFARKVKLARSSEPDPPACHRSRRRRCGNRLGVPGLLGGW